MIIHLKQIVIKSFEKKNRIFWISLLLFVGYALFYLGGLASVPFHPDESTQIYMSSDLDTMLHQFSDLFWQPEKAADLKQHYHELDAPISRYLIGMGRLFTAQPPLSADWDWSKTWDQNQASGALPDNALLLASRFSVSLLTLLSLLFLFDLVRQTTNPYTALLAVIIYALNPLILLHTRRAMAESALMFFTILFLWGLIRFPQNALRHGAALALAFCAKQTAVLLVLPALVAISAPAIKHNKLWQAASRFAIFLFTFAAICVLLNPFMWTDPLHAVTAALQDRQDLAARQQNMMASVSPEKALQSLPDHLASTIGAIFFQPPAVADVANYLDNTQLAQQAYFSNPLNLFLHDPLSSALFMILILLGFIFSCLRLVHQKEAAVNEALLILSFLSVLLGLVWSISLPFQRYYLPLMPFLSIWASIAITTPILSVINKTQKYQSS